MTAYGLKSVGENRFACGSCMFGVVRHTDVHQIGAMIAILIRICGHLTGRTISSIAVQTVHRIFDRKSRLEKLLGGTIKDGAGFDEIRLPTASWDLPIVSADPYLHRVCVKCCEEALARRVMKPSRLKVRVENAIATPRSGASSPRRSKGGHGPADVGQTIGRRVFVFRHDTYGHAFGAC